MDYFLNLATSGLVSGAIFGLVALAFAIIYKTTGVVNFAQGEVTMCVVYLAWTLGVTVQMPFWALLVCAVFIGAALSGILELVFIRPMSGEPQFAIIMTTVGVAIILRGIVPLIWGVESEAFDAPFKSALITVGPVVLFGEQVFALAIFVGVAIAVGVFFKYSRVGSAMRATALDESAALLMGINVRRLQSYAWMISGAVSALVGVSYAIIVSRAPDLWLLGMQSFPATILGGLDAPLGSALGGLIVGVSASLSEGYIGQGLKEISGFIIIIMILMVRPYGLLGDKELERV